MHAAWSKYVLITGLALVAAPRAAHAADLDDSVDDSVAGDLLSPAGEYLLVGGGVTGFADEATRDRYDVGGAWELRLGIGSRFFVGGEFAYVGSARSADASGPDLLSNGGEAVLRLQYPHEAGRWLIEPFAFGGIGWSRVSLRDAPAGVKDSDDVGVVPFGAGLTLGYEHFLVDARFTWRAAFDEDLPVDGGRSAADLEQWGVTTSIGYEF